MFGIKSLRARLTVFGLTAALAATTASATMAETVTFASFQPSNTTPANPFKYDQNGQKASPGGGISYFVTNTAPLRDPSDNVPPLNVTPTAIPVDFSFSNSNIFTAGLNPALLGTQAARLTLETRSIQGVNVFGGFAIQQQMYGTLEIRRVTPLLGKDLLLKVVFGSAGDPNSGGRYSGIIGAQTTGLAADEALGETVTFSSDFIDFAALGTFDQNMNLNFTSARPRLAINALTNFFQSHTASGSGTFSADAVPEPGTIACALTGIAFAVVGFRRRRVANA